MKQMNIIKDGDDLLIRIPNGAQDGELLKVFGSLVTGREIETDFREAEHLDVPPMPEEMMVIFREGPFAGMTPAEVLERDGIIRFMELNVMAAKAEKAGDKSLYERIIADLRTYLAMIAENGYTCPEDRQVLEKTLYLNQRIFATYIKQVCEQKGVKDLPDLLKILNDDQLKGAVVCVVEAFARKNAG